MTIDAATLPSFAAGATITAGQLFTITGTNFELWPAQLVLGYNADYVASSNSSNFTMELVEKTPTTLVFRARTTETYAGAHIWNIIGSPLYAPRAILTYE